MAFSDLQLEDLRARADLVTLVGRRVPLRKTGKDFVGLCPFHGEKSPSFYVVPGKHLWHCFGCGESGDVFKFFMKLDGLAFVDAVKLVATDSGIILVDEKLDPEEARRRAHLDELAGLMERAVRFYEQKLWHGGGQAAREHLVKRGIKEEAIRRFQLGFGGVGMDELTRALEKAGASIDLAIEAGLVIPSQRGGRGFDRFHGRLIVPIRIPRPPNGRAVALGGRFLEGITPARHDKKPAKYINSPETPLYLKGSVLFGLDVARDGIRRSERAVVVEGYFDVIGVHQAGLPLAVATCGTSLTPGHLDLLLRVGAREIVFLFDGDAAGLKAAARAAEMCARAQVPAKVATLPQGLDPDEFARQRGGEGLNALLDRAKPTVEHLLDAALTDMGHAATVEQRARIVHDLRPLVLAAPDTLSRELYVAQIAERIGVSVAAVQAALYDAEGRGERAVAEPSRPAHTRPSPDRGERQAGPSAEPGDAPASGRRPSAQPTVSQAELGLVIALLKFPAALGPVAESEGVIPLFTHPELRALGEALVASVHEQVEPVPETLIGALVDPRLRNTVDQQWRADDSSLEQASQHLLRLFDKLRQETRRRQAQAALLQSRQLPADAEARRAFDEEQQRILDESRAVHRRIRERGHRTT